MPSEHSAQAIHQSEESDGSSKRMPCFEQRTTDEDHHANSSYCCQHQSNCMQNFSCVFDLTDETTCFENLSFQSARYQNAVGSRDEVVCVELLAEAEQGIIVPLRRKVAAFGIEGSIIAHFQSSGRQREESNFWSVDKIASFKPASLAGVTQVIVLFS